MIIKKLLDKNIFKKIESISNPPIARSNHAAVLLNNSMIIYGGWDGTKTLNDMYELSLGNIFYFLINSKILFCGIA